MFYERKQRKMKFQKTLVKCRNILFLCHNTIELGRKLQDKFVSQHNSLVLRHKFKRALNFMSQHFLLCHDI